MAEKCVPIKVSFLPKRIAPRFVGSDEQPIKPKCEKKTQDRNIVQKKRPRTMSPVRNQKKPESVEHNSTDNSVDDDTDEDLYDSENASVEETTYGVLYDSVNLHCHLVKYTSQGGQFQSTKAYHVTSPFQNVKKSVFAKEHTHALYMPSKLIHRSGQPLHSHKLYSVEEFVNITDIDSTVLDTLFENIQ